VLDLETRMKIGKEFGKIHNTDPKWLEDSGSYSDYNMRIWNLLTLDRIPDSVAHVSRKYDIYLIEMFGTRVTGTVMFTNGSEFEFVNPKKTDYEDYMMWVIDYFKRNPDIDKRLMPIYVQQITWEYLRWHAAIDESGQLWRSWFDEDPRDSIATEYRPFLSLTPEWLRNN
jgi:hypothetical protein